MRRIDLAGPFRYRHGWVLISDPGASAQHGKEVAGDLGDGKGVVVGTYNHSRHSVTDSGGREHPVVAVNGERNEAGFKGNVAGSHLPPDIKQGMEAYDRALRMGAARLASGVVKPRSGAAPTGVHLNPRPSFGRYNGGRASTSFSNLPGRYVDMASQPKLGSGGRFRKLSATLAARGAHNPDALAAYIGRRKYGAKKMGALSHHGHSGDGLAGILLAGYTHTHTHTHSHEGGDRPHTHSDDDYDNDSARGTGAAGTSVPRAPGVLRTPARGSRASTGVSGSQYTVRGGSPNMGLANGGQRSVDLAALHPRLAVTGPFDFMVNRSSEEPGRATVRHRRGGDVIGDLLKLEDGTWAGVLGGRQLEPRVQQRAALLELIGAHNRTVVQADRPMPLQQPPAQPSLLSQMGITNVRAFATPANGAGDGPRTTSMGDSDGDDDAGTDGLSPKGKAIYKKLCARGFPKARALAFAKRAQNFGGKKPAAA